MTCNVWHLMGFRHPVVQSKRCASLFCKRGKTERDMQVSFAKEPYKRDHILHKTHIISRSLIIVAHLERDMHVSFAKEPYLGTSLLQKSPVKETILYPRDCQVSFVKQEKPSQQRYSSLFCKRALSWQVSFAKEPCRSNCCTTCGKVAFMVASMGIFTFFFFRHVCV